jgi:hypothetical protein
VTGPKRQLRRFCRRTGRRGNAWTPKNTAPEDAKSAAGYPPILFRRVHLAPGLDLGVGCVDRIARGPRPHRESAWAGPPLRPNGNINTRKTEEKSKTATPKSVAIKNRPDLLFSITYGEF